MNATFISQIETESTGGGVMNDYVTLKDGKVILIHECGICLFPNIETAKSSDCDGAIGAIDFPDGEITI